MGDSQTLRLLDEMADSSEREFIVPTSSRKTWNVHVNKKYVTNAMSFAHGGREVDELNTTIKISKIVIY